MLRILILCLLCCPGIFAADETAPPPPAPTPPITVEPGTRIPLTLINSLSTKNSQEGDHVYLRTAFPVIVAGRIAIPPGSYVAGTLTHLKRPGRVKGRGELFLRFDSLTLPNGVLRAFGGRLSALDGDEKLDSTEGMVKGSGSVGHDAGIIAGTAASGASLGAIVGAVSGSPIKGTLAGAGAGAAAGLLGVLLTRGPDATLSQGTTVEMVLDRPIVYQPAELTFTTMDPLGMPIAAPAKPAASANRTWRPF